MKSYAIDVYGGNVAAGEVRTGYVWRDLPIEAIGGRLVGIEGMLSSFVKLHVDTWLTLGRPTQNGDKQGPDIFGILKSGDAGNATLCNMGLDLPIRYSVLYVNEWAHNMLSGPFDWHVGYVLYYDEAPA